MEETQSVHVSIQRPEKSSRLLALLFVLFLIPKLVLIVPHLVILYFLGIASFIAAFAAQVVVLFTGKYPENIHNFVSGVIRWQLRVNAYLLGLVDKYPLFKLN